MENMTIDEAIKHAEEVAEEQEELYRSCPASGGTRKFHCDGTKDCRAVMNGKNKGCQKCAKEHRLIAEWLEDYKRLLKQESVLDKIRAEIKEESRFCPLTEGLERALEIIDKCTAERSGKE